MFGVRNLLLSYIVIALLWFIEPSINSVTFMNGVTLWYIILWLCAWIQIAFLLETRLNFAHKYAISLLVLLRIFFLAGVIIAMLQWTLGGAEFRENAARWLAYIGNLNPDLAVLGQRVEFSPIAIYTVMFYLEVLLIGKSYFNRLRSDLPVGWSYRTSFNIFYKALFHAFRRKERAK